jgi:hypothetical protein
MVDLSKLPPWLAVCAEAALTILQVAIFFGFIWFAWFCVWVFA